MKKLGKRPNVLILAGDGLNSEKETARAFNMAGGTAHIIHINDLICNKKLLNQYEIMALPGGFSFGDELGSGQVLSLKIKHQLKDEWEQLFMKKNLSLGFAMVFKF